jgi:acyl dehydratase
VVKITSETKQGAEFLGKEKVVSWPRIWAFSGGAFSNTGWPRKNIHTDLDFAKSCGLPYVATSATQFQAYAIELLLDLFGPDWLTYGSMDVKFINVVDAGDVLTTKCVVSSVERMNDAIKYNVEISTDNQNGHKVQVGSAVGYLGKINPEKFRQEIPTPEVSIRLEGRVGLQPLEFTVTPELNQQYLFALEDFNPWYLQPSNEGAPLVHPGLLLNMSNGTRSPSYSTPAGRAGFHARDQAVFINPARVGDKLKVIWSSVGSYEKRGRSYSVSETVVTNQEDIEILKRFNHSTIASSEYSKEYKK